jgi:hypothetical protein
MNGSSFSSSKTFLSVCVLWPAGESMGLKLGLHARAHEERVNEHDLVDIGQPAQHGGLDRARIDDADVDRAQLLGVGVGGSSKARSVSSGHSVEKTPWMRRTWSSLRVRRTSSQDAPSCSPRMPCMALQNIKLRSRRP